MRHTWEPPWAPHVEGWYEDRVVGPDGPEPAPVGATCTVCKSSFRRMCASGLMRQWITRFAKDHLHRSPLAPLPTK